MHQVKANTFAIGMFMKFLIKAKDAVFHFFNIKAYAFIPEYKLVYAIEIF